MSVNSAELDKPEQCPKSAQVVLQAIRVIAIAFAVAGPGSLFLIMCAASREVVDPDFNVVVCGGSAAMVLASAGLVLLSSRALAGRLWAYYTLVVLLGLASGSSAMGLLLCQALNWLVPIAPAIFLFLLLAPSSRYRRYAQTRGGSHSVAASEPPPKEVH